MGLENLAQGLKNSAFFFIIIPVNAQFQLETVKSSLQKSYCLEKPDNYFSTQHLKIWTQKSLWVPFYSGYFVILTPRAKPC